MRCSRRQCLGLSRALQPWAEHSKASLRASKQEGLWRSRLKLANSVLTVSAAVSVPAKNNATADTKEAHVPTHTTIQTSEQRRGKAREFVAAGGEMSAVSASVLKRRILVANTLAHLKPVALNMSTQKSTQGVQTSAKVSSQDLWKVKVPLGSGTSPKWS